MTAASQMTPHEIIVLLSRGIGQRKLYFSTHPKMRDCLNDCMDQLHRFFELSNRESFFVGVDRSRFIYEGRYLTSSTIVGSKLIALAGQLSCGGFTIDASMTEAELGALMDIAVELDEPVPSLEHGQDLLASRNIAGITLAAPYHRDDQDEDDVRDTWQGGQGDDHEELVMIDQALFTAVNQVHDRVKQGSRIDIGETRAASESLIRSIKEGFCDLMQHVQYPDFDTYTVGHSVRMSLLGVLVAKTMEWDDASLVEFSTAGLLHDVGKGRIPEEILFKPGRLDEEERRIMETHAHLGAEILMETKGVGRMAVAAAYGHHMHENGGGYPVPTGLRERSLATSILQVCDVFEALTAIRPYKRPLTPRQAYEAMVSMQGFFNPIAFQAFVRAVGLYPPGSHVRLSDGREGDVIAAGIAFDRPQVRLRDETGDGRSPEAEILELDSRGCGQLHVAELLIDGALAPAAPTLKDEPVPS